MKNVIKTKNTHIIIYVGKKYIKVIAEFSEEGIVTPLFLFLDGKKYDVSRVVGTKRIAADIGGTGYCYELIVDNKNIRIWLEDIVFNKVIGARWFLSSGELK